MLGATSRTPRERLSLGEGSQVSPSGLEMPAVGDPFRGQTAYVREGVARRLVPAPSSNEALNRLARLAASLTGSPAAQVSLLTDVEHIVAGHGLEPGVIGSETPLEDALCTVTVAEGAPVAVPDATLDERVNHRALVTRGDIGSYLGVPLVTDSGERIGALCVFGTHQRQWTPNDMELLEHLAGPVVAELQLAALTAEYDTNRVVWQLAIDAAGVGAFDWDVTTGALRWDDRLMEMFGYDQDSFSLDIEAFNARLHPDDLPRVTGALEQAVENCGDYAAEYRVVLPSGEVRWITARGRALCGDDGATERVIGAAYDTTEVHEGEARVARVLEAMSTAFYSLDENWCFSYVNAEAERLLGQPREALLGRNIWELFPAAVDSDFERSYRTAVETGEAVSFEAYYPQPLDGWYELRAHPMPEGLSVYFVEVTERRRAQQQLERAARRNDLLARISGALTGTLDAEEAVAQLTRSLVPELGDWSMVTLLEGRSSDWRRRLRDLGFWHADPEMRQVLERYNEVKLDSAYDSKLVQEVLSDDAETIVIEDSRPLIDQVLRPGEARDLALRLDPGPAISLPLRGRGRLIGMLSLNRRAGQPPFDSHDVEVLEEVAARAGLALDNARLFAEQRDLAEGLQRSLLTEPGGSERLSIAVRYEPAAEAAQVGGDWYDSFLVREGVTTVVIGDVVGHDTAAAAAMGQVRGLLRAIGVHTGDGPAQVLRGVDRAMETLRVDVTATAVVATLERIPPEERTGPAVKRLCWANAGHPDPVLITPEGEVVALSGASADLLLGLDPSADRAECVVGLEPGATVLLYTDGLVERRGQGLDEGLAQLRGVLRQLDVPTIGLDELCDELLLRMRPPGRREDDVALVAVRVR
jgi:PAS domain S-box-containing protein